MFLTEAWAQAGAPGTGNPIMQFVPMILIFVVFYFLLIRPSVRRQKSHQEMLKGLKIGDQVVTASGLIGTIKNMTDKIVTIEIADSVRVKMLRGQVSHIVTGSLDDVPEAAT